MSDDPSFPRWVMQLVSGLERLEAGQERLRADVMGRIDRLQDAITAIRDDIGVNFGAAERVREAHEGTRREVASLGAQLSLMERQIMRLQSDVRALKGEL